MLDCGAGTGSTALLAARKIGALGKVVILDTSQEMLAVAGNKFARSGLSSNAEFVIGDMLALPFENNVFDVVLSTYSACPLQDPAKGAKELCRVTRPGGKIGIAHSFHSATPFLKWMGEKVECAVWLMPSISLGCRSVSVLPTLEQAGCRIIFRRQIGIPLWPFLVFVAEKPEA